MSYRFRVTRVLIAGAVVVVMLGTSTPVPASEAPLLPPAVHAAAAQLQPTRALIDATRATLGSGGAHAALAAATVARTGDAAPAALGLPGRPGLPQLVATVKTALTAVKAARTPATLRAHRRFLQAQRDLATPPPCSGTGLDCPARVGYVNEDRVRRAAADANLQRLARVTQVQSARLATAIDGALPTLATGAPAAASSAPCDVLDQSPLVCVSGEGETAYPADHDYALTIDRGGNDVYAGSAGAVGYLAPTPVQINIDLAGDDRYVAEVPIAHGTGWTGIGMLLDQAGDDLYRADGWAVPSPEGAPAGLTAQGAGIFGVGLLRDAAGHDVYEAVSPVTRAQAHATGGTGVLADDAGDDRYTVTSADGPRMPEQESFLAATALDGQASAMVGGTAVLFDRSGDDVFAMRAAGGRDAPVQNGYVGQLWVTGQAYGLIGGFGLLLTGERGRDSHTTYDMRADARGLMLSWVWGQGNAATASMGVIDDLSGDDSYDLHATRVQRYGGPDSSTVVVTESHHSGGNVPVQAIGQAVGLAANAAAVLDHAGDDTYTVTAADDAAVRAVAAEGTAAVAELFPMKLSVRAQGYGFAQGAVAALIDESGDDTYTAVLQHALRAEAVGASGDPAGRSAAYANANEFPYTPFYVAGQGAAGTGTPDCAGCLIDLAGRDHYTGALRVTASASPDRDNVSGAVGRPGFLAQAGGLFADLDGGEQDVYHDDIAYPRCSGRVAEPGTWRGCSLSEEQANGDRGVGHATSAPVRSDLIVTPDPANPAASTVGERMSLAAKVTTPDGAPVAGVPVSFRLNFWWPRSTASTLLCQDPSLSCVFSQDFGPSREAVTDEYGVARTTLVLWGSKTTNGGATISEYIERYPDTTPRLVFIVPSSTATRQAEATAPLALSVDDQ